MKISRETYEKIEGLRLVGLRDVLINANRMQFGDDEGAYDTGIKHGVHMLTDRILEAYDFGREQVKEFYLYAKALESEDPPVVIEGL